MLLEQLDLHMKKKKMNPHTHTHTNKSLEKTLRNMVRDLAYQRGEVSRGEMGAGSWGQAKHPV